MGLPNEVLCKGLDLDLEVTANLSITLPGAAELSAFLNPGDVPILSDLCSGLIGQVNASLTPLVPIFRLLDVALCLFKVVEAIPDTIGPPPDPTAIIKEIVACAQKVSFLLELIPQISVCVFIKGIITLILCALESLRDSLANLVQLQVDISAADARIAELEGLGLDASFAIDGLDCAKANLDAEIAGATSGNEALNRLIGLLNVFMSLAGLEPIPTLDDIDASAGIDLEVLDVPIEALELVLKVLPC